MGTLFFYMDEAGNFDFSPKGSKFFILTAIAMRRPFSHLPKLDGVKYDCLESGINEKRLPNYHEFHATNDVQAVRDRVFETIRQECADANIYSVILRKNKTNPSLRSPEKLYSNAFSWLMKYAISREAVNQGDLVVAVSDYVNFKGKNDALRAAIKTNLDRQLTPLGATYKYYQHVSESDLNLQVADYCCWAIQRKWERGDTRAFLEIGNMVRGEGDLFVNGDCEYYQFARP